MGAMVLGLVGVLLVAFVVGLLWILVGLGRVASKGGFGMRSARGFAEVAAREGWVHAAQDEELPRRFSPILPEAFDNTAALDVLSGHVEGREIAMFRYPALEAGKGSLNVWAVRFPHSVDGDFTPHLEGQGFVSWRVENGFLQAWDMSPERDVRGLLVKLQSLVRAAGEAAPS